MTTIRELPLTNLYLQPYSLNEETYVNHRELPYSYMPQHISAKSHKGLLTFNFHSPFTIGIDKTLLSSISFNFIIVSATLSYSYHQLVLYIELLLLQLQKPLLAFPRFIKGANFNLTWILLHWSVYCGFDEKCSFDCD